MKSQEKKAERGYQLMAEAARQIHFLPARTLIDIAQAINPEVKEHYCSVHLFRSVNYGGAVSPMTYTLATESMIYLSHVPTTLAFFRELWRREKSPATQDEIRAVVAFPRSKEDSRTVWLDCETGMPWVSPASLHVRQCLSAEERQKTEDFYLEATRRARAVLEGVSEPATVTA